MTGKGLAVALESAAGKEEKQEDKKMTNKEIGTAIKKELKEAGYNTRDFSVRVRDSYHDTAIIISIKNPEINRKEIEKLLHHWEEIDQDAASGEILAGCNIYLFISYADGIFDIPAQEWAATAQGLMSSKDNIISVFNGLYFICNAGKKEIRQQDEREHCTFLVSSFKDLCIFLYKFAKFGTIAA